MRLHFVNTSNPEIDRPAVMWLRERVSLDMKVRMLAAGEEWPEYDHGWFY